ncbi:MAG: sensor histidine kinase, partial [Rectinema sp.]|nr:sensor histidine kinase [Rectinema sp.]
MHSRIKTNLQIIASLAHLRQMEGAGEEPDAMLREIQAQIRSIALVHEALYHAERVDRISVRDFLAQFAKAAMDALETVGSRVKVGVRADEMELDPDRLVPLSLAVLEILSGIYRFSYRSREEVQVELMFTAESSSRAVLEISGKGIFPSLDSETLAALLEQAGAQLEKGGDREAVERCRFVVNGIKG